MALRGQWVRLFPGDGTERMGLALDDAQQGSLRVGWINYKPGDAAVASVAALRALGTLTTAQFGGAGTVSPPYWLED